MFLWRISDYSDLAGNGGLLASGRWHTQGRPIVYLAESPAAALVEVLVHLELDLEWFPKTYTLLKAEADENVSLRQLRMEDFPQQWTTNQVLTQTRGDEWLATGDTALLRVPSAIIPETHNILLNPNHVDVRRIRILWHAKFPWDRRLVNQKLSR